jgi:RNA polymerase sigma-70 factor (ECF subfamily)
MNRRRRPHPVEDIAILTGAGPTFGTAAEPSPEEQIVLQILPDDLQRAIESLDSKFQTVLVLVDINGLTYGEASELLDVPLGTVMSRLSRARQRVRAHLHVSAQHEGSRR